MQNQGLKALIFGGTGAIGADLIVALLASSKWEKVHCVVRKRLEQWNNLPGRQKLTVQIAQNMDNYFTDKQLKYKGFDSLFCCLGSQTKHGNQTFIKVDKTYPLLAADIAVSNKIPHYLLVSSMGSDPKSWFLYPRIKGEVENELKEKKINLLSIFKPGILRNRRDSRTIQKIFGIIPIIQGIEAKAFAEALKLAAQKYHQQALNAKQNVQIFENKHILKFLETKGASKN